MSAKPERILATPRQIERAREEYQTDDIEIDDGALASPNEDGTWVAAWVHVPRCESDCVDAECEGSCAREAGAIDYACIDDTCDDCGERHRPGDCETANESIIAQEGGRS